MPSFNVLEDYVVHVLMSTLEGHGGEIRHIFPTKDGTGVQTPVGFFMAFIAEPSEIRPRHWEVQLFLRADVQYDLRQKRCRIVTSNRTDSEMVYHPDLPRNLGNALIEHGFCPQPIALSVNLFRETAFVEFGKTWAEDD